MVGLVCAPSIEWGWGDRCALLGLSEGVCVWGVLLAVETPAILYGIQNKHLFLTTMGFQIPKS